MLVYCWCSSRGLCNQPILHPAEAPRVTARPIPWQDFVPALFGALDCLLDFQTASPESHLADRDRTGISWDYWGKSKWASILGGMDRIRSCIWCDHDCTSRSLESLYRWKMPWDREKIWKVGHSIRRVTEQAKLNQDSSHALIPSFTNSEEASILTFASHKWIVTLNKWVKKNWQIAPLADGYRVRSILAISMTRESLDPLPSPSREQQLDT